MPELGPQEIVESLGRIWCEQAVDVGRRWLCRRDMTDTFTRPEVEMIVTLEEAHVGVDALEEELRRNHGKEEGQRG